MQSQAPSGPALIDVRQVAAKLGCSPKHVYRLAAAGRMPGPVHLGSLVRWNVTAIDDWLAGGCRDVPKMGTEPSSRSVRGGISW